MATISKDIIQLILADVVETGRKLGSGAYGEVVEVRLAGLRCAGKKLHDLFFNQSPPSEQRAIVARFEEECLRLSKLRHPNIVQLIGVHFIRGSQLPMMIMELLPMSLTQCLERYQQVPGLLKISILYDVSLGMLYLHSQIPPLIHRDLTASNVLLTSNMSAKLADLAVARYVNLNPTQLTAHMTQCPGTPAYMPPEALTYKPQYDEKLDIFSFGCLILHVCIQQWPLPAPLLASDPQNPEILKPHNEIQRRQKYFDLVDNSNPLKSLAWECLHNLASQRPTSANIASKLEQMYRSHATSSPHFLDLFMENLAFREQEELSKKEEMKLTEENTQLSKENTQLSKEKLALTQQTVEKDDIIVQLKEKFAALTSVQIEAVRRDVQTKDQQLQEKDQQLQQQNQQIQEMEQRLLFFQQQLQKKDQQIQRKDQQILEKDQHLQLAQQQMQEKDRSLRRSQHQVQQLHSNLSRLSTEPWEINREELTITQEILGTGAYGEVRVAIFRGLRVAAKFLHKIIASEYNLHRLSREMTIAAQVRHPNLLLFIGATTQGQPSIILTELMATSLRAELDRGQISQKQIKSIAIDVSCGLHYLHMKKPEPIIHRDVSSPNVLMELFGAGSWRAKVSDYGSANFVRQVTSTSVYPGNPCYAAPEADLPNKHSPKMDVYSFGVLLTEMSLHQPPKTTVTGRAEQAQMVQCHALADIIEECMASSPDNRPTLGQVMEKLRQI